MPDDLRRTRKLSIQAMKLSVKFQLDENHFFTLQRKCQNRNERYHLNSVSEAYGPLEHPVFLSSEQQYKEVLVRRSIVSYHVFRSSE